MADVRVKQEPAEEVENRIKELCQQFPHGITDQVIQNDMPQLEAQHRAMAINRLLSVGQLDLLRNSSGLLYRMKDTQTASKMKGSDNQEKLVYLVMEGAGNKVKRRRKPNWTQDQLLLLARLVHERKEVIKGKFGVGITYRTKKEAWESVCARVNAAFPSLPRTGDECEKRWFSLQSQAKAEIAEHRRQASTGGGSAPKDLSHMASVVYSVLGYAHPSVSAGPEGGYEGGHATPSESAEGGYAHPSSEGPERGADPAGKRLDQAQRADGSAGDRPGRAPGRAPPLPAPSGPAPLPPSPLPFPPSSSPPPPAAPGPPSPRPPALASPPPAGGGSLLEQKLELEISLLRKQHALVDRQQALVDRQHRLLDVQEQYYSEPPQIKEEQELWTNQGAELWTNQGAELQCDTTDSMFTSFTVNALCDLDDSSHLPRPASS